MGVAGINMTPTSCPSAL